MSPAIYKPGSVPTPSNAPHLSGFFKAKALPGMEREFKAAKDDLMAHLSVKPVAWEYLRGEKPGGHDAFSKDSDKWDMDKTTKQRILVDLSDRSTFIDLSAIGPWHIAEFLKGGDWEERIVAHCLRPSKLQMGVIEPEPETQLPRPAEVEAPSLNTDFAVEGESGILGEFEPPSEDTWEPEGTTSDFPVEETTDMVKFTPAPKTKLDPRTKVAAKQTAKPALKKVAAPAPVVPVREDVLKALLRRKFIKDALNEGRLTEANLRKTPTPRLVKMLERGTFNG